MARRYRMGQRAAAQEEIRERILQATMSVHDEKGVAPTTFADVAARAGVGVATVYRHFGTLGELIQACGGHVWMEMRPPTPDMADALFAGLTGRHERLVRLVEELDGFYRRGAYRLRLAGRDRELVPELQAFLSAVEGGVAANVGAALAGASDETVRLATAVANFHVWDQLQKTGLPAAALRPLMVRLIEAAITPADHP